MKLLQNKDNSKAPDVDFPYGSMRDRSLGTPGNKVNADFMSDYTQFFERIMALSGLTANGLPDNATNGFQLVDAAIRVIKPYKVYTALISQVGTSNPTVQVLGTNEIGGISWARTGTGLYEGTLTGAFSNLKTFCFLQASDTATFLIYRADSDTIQIGTTFQGNDTGVDGVLNQTSLEIRVYY